MILKLFVKYTHLKLCIRACAINVIFDVYNKVYIHLFNFLDTFQARNLTTPLRTCNNRLNLIGDRKHYITDEDKSRGVEISRTKTGEREQGTAVGLAPM